MRPTETRKGFFMNKHELGDGPLSGWELELVAALVRLLVLGLGCLVPIVLFFPGLFEEHWAIGTLGSVALILIVIQWNRIEGWVRDTTGKG